MKKYVHPKTEVIGEVPRELVCDSLLGDSTEDFTESEEIEW